MNKNKIALLVDSCTDVPRNIIEQYGMYVLPLKINYQGKEYLDGVTITAQEVYENLEIEIPKTSLPSGEEILTIFDQVKADGFEKLLVVTISSGLSGTHNFIDLLARDYEGLDIHVIDTKNIGIGSGLTAISAGRLIAEDLNWEDLKVAVQNETDKTKVFFCVKTLEYLKKGGRIGLVTSILGNALDLKPIISCNDDGIYYTVSKVRGRKQSLRKAIDLATDFVKTNAHYNIAVVHGNALDEANEIKEKILEILPNAILVFDGQISPALGVHTGPGLIGIAVQKID